jgi:DNA-binding GntR family transcriptional regulator
MWALAKSVLSLIFSELPTLIRGISNLIQQYKKSRRIDEENETRKQIDKAIEQGDEKLAKDLLARQLSRLRRNLDD